MLSTAQRVVCSKQHKAQKQICGAIVRLFKFLLPDYYIQFCGNLQVKCGKLVVAVSSPERQQNLLKWQKLSKLYGSGVIPDGLLECLHGDLNDWSQCFGESAAAQAPVTSAAEALVFSCLQEVQESLLQLLRRRILCVDSHPTVIRMFTFKPHVECCLLLDFLGFVIEIINVSPIKARDRSRRRVDKVLAVF